MFLAAPVRQIDECQNLGKFVNPLQPGVAFLYPQKTSENLMFSGGMEKQHWAIMG